MEPFEECQICKKKWHRICAMHSNKIIPEGFICDPCQIKTNRPKVENKFTAKSKLGKIWAISYLLLKNSELPQCHLSRFIEARANGFLQQKLTQPNDPKVEVVIRVVCNSDKEVEVKPWMVNK
jgi:E1A/CREB-binding protein